MSWGHGVKKAVFIKTFDMALSEEDYWSQHGKYRTPLFHGIFSEARCKHWCVTGMLTGLHLIRYATAPGNLLPFLLAFIRHSTTNGFAPLLDFVAVLEPGLAHRLAPWCALTPVSPINTPWLRLFTSETTLSVGCHKIC
jgi:hypothetical protein